MKGRLLELLRERAEDGFTSGESLAAALGVSRVAVWKALRSLKEAGYPVKTEERGYALTRPGDDFLYPWEFPGISHFYHWESTDSTMNRARELAERGVPGGTVIAAETQTAGMGRNGRAWSSPRGGLFFTLVERPNLGIADYTRLVTAAHLTLGITITEICGIPAQLRWPNDVYLRGKKAAGILTELSGAGDRIRWIAIGIGVNVNKTPPGTAACAEAAGHPLSRRELLLKFLDTLESTLALNPADLKKGWNRSAGVIGRQVRVIAPDHGAGEKTLERGTFLGIDSQGRGLVKGGRGIIPYAPGSASLRI
ncbi:MAG: biotin--[acetyl-CoA-carboxylase] ligase [Treponema sp.]|nr:biotin--[acetyl-CoA-carboxylase] ligase [Treponema sp.]